MENNQKYNKSDKNSIEKHLKSNKDNLVSISGKKKSILSNFPFLGRGLFKYYLGKIFAHDFVDEIWKDGNFLWW